MWHEREFRFPGEPYPRFASEALWSLVTVGVVAVFLLQFGAPLLAVGATAGVVASGLGWMLYRRVETERTRLIRAARPRMGTLMARYGVAPRASRTAGQGA